MSQPKAIAVDVGRWPDIARRRRSAFRGRIARLLLERAAQRIAVRVQLPDGSNRGLAGVAHPVMAVADDQLFHRLGQDLKIGLGESYMAGEWGTGGDDDLADVLTPFAERLLDIVPAWMRRFRTWVEPIQPHHERNHREGARSNIARHYDLSNDLFKLFLDETLTYSSAWFEDRGSAGFADLAAAQRRKVDGILDFAAVKSGSSVLEIGSGWGQLAIQAAQRGASVHTITLSEEQKALAEERFAAAGVADSVNIELRDYRDVAGQYDAVVSVEMIEAVGEEFWAEYFATVARNLRVGGHFGLQAITMPHDRMLASRHAYTWIHKYIFPGGLIPSVEAIEQQCAANGLVIRDRRSLGLDYAKTLEIWRKRFNQKSTEVAALGFDEVFRRMWEFYLAYSEAGFRARHLDVWQLSIERVR